MALLRDAGASGRSVADHLLTSSWPAPTPCWTGSAARRSCRCRPLSAAPQSAATLAFERALGERLRRAYPADAAGTVLFPFRRLFFVATDASV